MPSAGNITWPIGQANFSQRLISGFIGDYATEAPNNTDITAINNAGMTTQVSTITVDTGTASATYSFVLNGTTISYVNGLSTDTTVIADAIEQQLLADGYVGAYVTVSQATNVVTLTAKVPGLLGAFTLTDSDDKLTIATGTAAADASTVAFGRCLIATGNNVDTRGTQTAAIPTTSTLTAQVDTWVATGTYESAVELMWSITVGGMTYGGSIAMASNLDTSMAALVTDMNARLPANTVLAAYDAASDTLTLTAEIKGQGFNWDIGVGAHTTAAPPAYPTTTTRTTISTDINKCFLGIAERDASIMMAAVSTTEVTYPANAPMRVATQGDIWVANSQTIVQFACPVYVETSGSDAGKFFNTSSSTRPPLFKAKWMYGSDSGDRAVLKIQPAPFQ